MANENNKMKSLIFLMLGMVKIMPGIYLFYNEKQLIIQLRRFRNKKNRMKTYIAQQTRHGYFVAAFYPITSVFPFRLAA